MDVAGINSRAEEIVVIFGPTFTIMSYNNYKSIVTKMQMSSDGSKRFRFIVKIDKKIQLFSFGIKYGLKK